MWISITYYYAAILSEHFRIKKGVLVEPNPELCNVINKERHMYKCKYIENFWWERDKGIWTRWVIIKSVLMLKCKKIIKCYAIIFQMDDLMSCQ